jgi:DNA-binding IclR family transcriptional regulator
LDDKEIGRVLASGASLLAPFEHQGAQTDAIFDRVRQARLDGYVAGSEMVTTGIYGVAVPILPRTGLLQFAISLSMVVSVLPPDEAKQIAARIRAAIRKRPSQD